MQPAATPIDYTPSYRAMLHRMAEIGMAAAERIFAQLPAQPAEPPAEPHAPEAPTAPVTIELDRIARMIRRNAHTSDRLGRPLPVRRTNREGLPLEVCRRLLMKDVEEAIQEEIPSEHQDRFREDLYERLERPEIDDEIEFRPLPQVMTEIRQEMGFEDIPGASPWVRRTAAQWTELCRRSACPPGSNPLTTTPATIPRPEPGKRQTPGTLHNLHAVRIRGKPAPT